MTEVGVGTRPLQQWALAKYAGSGLEGSKRKDAHSCVAAPNLDAVRSQIATRGAYSCDLLFEAPFASSILADMTL